MTIDEVYKLVQVFANKEQRGFISPSDFNLLAKQAELELYNKRLSIIKQKSPTRRSQGVYAENLAPELARQDIATFLTRSDMTVTAKDAPYLGVTVNLITDYVESMFINVDEHHDISNNIPLDIVEPKDINQILRSSLVKPSIEYPIALLGSEGGTSKVFSVFPDTIKKVIAYHYRYANNPKWSYVTVAGKPVHDSSSSNAFKISSRCHGEIVVKILEYLGVSIREADVVQYAQASELKADS
jgi:hypothetical protein